ncbi:MAG: diacylglycerol kinase family protein [Verrucomicrobiota bacterium]
MVFSDAIRGLVSVFRSERNFRIHVGAALVVVVAGFLFQVSVGDWFALVFSIGFVLTAEVLNTAIEYLADAIHPEMDPGIRMTKDAAAGGVLVASVAAAVVGAIVFLPEIWELLPKN